MDAGCEWTSMGIFYMRCIDRIGSFGHLRNGAESLPATAQRVQQATGGLALLQKLDGRDPNPPMPRKLGQPINGATLRHIETTSKSGRR